MERERIDSFERMKVWQDAHALVLRMFELTPQIPTEQQDALAVPMEKAAVEVPKSIAEGFKRRGPRNKAHFYNIAQSALESLRYYLILCRDLKIEIPYEELAGKLEHVARMLDGLVRSMTRDDGGGGGGRQRHRSRGRGGRGGQGGHGGHGGHGGGGRPGPEGIGERPQDDGLEAGGESFEVEDRGQDRDGPATYDPDANT